MMKSQITLLATIIIVSSPVVAFSNTENDQTGFSAQRGKEIWNEQFSTSSQSRSCATCHTDDPRKPGKHASTGKPIKPMAPSINANRLTDQRKIEKWFKRNCKWTIGRECTDQEKGNVLEFLKNI